MPKYFHLNNSDNLACVCPGPGYHLLHSPVLDKTDEIYP